ncbi:hypothetical protein ACQ4M4_17900 [Leptolyngbya sp. AN02str]|uniref:hypothetical protein n=1 Tax=Leptolyngbya sp. AN02str TaxID=3423363 RepID=UPI003D317E76
MIRGFKALIKHVRVLVLTALCALMVFSNMAPAMAYGSDRSALDEGEAPINDIYRKSEEALRKEPRSMKELQNEAQKGINEVQGDADVNQMQRDDNSKQATTVKDRVEDALDNIFQRD